MGYSLHQVANTLGVDYTSFGRPHDALPDARTLDATIKNFPNLYGSLYSWHETALTTVPGVGLRTETILFRHNIRSTESLVTFAVHCCFHSNPPYKVAIDLSLHKTFRMDSSSSLDSVSARMEMRARICHALRRMGIARPTKIADWCVAGVCIFHENTRV